LLLLRHFQPFLYRLITDLCIVKYKNDKDSINYIHLQLTDETKVLLSSSDKPISEIAYGLGFEHLIQKVSYDEIINNTLPIY
jgi:AraC-like DNA-binding protein